jgi:NADH:ubiquinone oxidoreductase subunit 2 (subunit N)
MVIYNVSLGLLFSTIFQFNLTNFKTLYSFANFTTLHHAAKILTIALFSMAGVPPLLGFFSKVLVFILLSDSSYFILFFLFFPLVFFSLYFYVQNIRFLNISKLATTPTTHLLEVRSSLIYYSITTPTLFFLLFGMFYNEDLFLVINWLLV